MTLAAGDVVQREVTVTRADLVRYAGAACDFNLVHWSDSAAHAAGLPGVIAHGMFSMAIAVRAAEELCGPDVLVAECQARFTAPLVVPDGAGTVLTVTVEATGVAAGSGSAPETEVELRASAAGVTVLSGRCRLQPALRIAEGR